MIVHLVYCGLKDDTSCALITEVHYGIEGGISVLGCLTTNIYGSGSWRPVVEAKDGVGCHVSNLRKCEPGMIGRQVTLTIPEQRILISSSIPKMTAGRSSELRSITASRVGSLPRVGEGRKSLSELPLRTSLSPAADTEAAVGTSFSSGPMTMLSGSLPP